jgi:hypothetical protein
MQLFGFQDKINKISRTLVMVENKILCTVLQVSKKALLKLLTVLNAKLKLYLCYNPELIGNLFHNAALTQLLAVHKFISIQPPCV